VCDSERQEAEYDDNEPDGSMPVLQSNSSGSDDGSDAELDEEPEQAPAPAAVPANRAPLGQRTKARKSLAMQQREANCAAEAVKEADKRAAKHECAQRAEAEGRASEARVGIERAQADAAAAARLDKASSVATSAMVGLVANLGQELAEVLEVVEAADMRQQVEGIAQQFEITERMHGARPGLERRDRAAYAAGGGRARDGADDERDARAE
jgi:hypothetical protein